jgi:hypothetical protein
MKLESFRCDTCGTVLKHNVGPLSFVSARVTSWKAHIPEVGPEHHFCCTRCLGQWLAQFKYIRKEICGDLLTKDS